MKFNSKISDYAFIGLMVLAVLCMAMFIVWVVTGIWWPAVLLSAVLIFGVAPIYFHTYYVLDKDELFIYSSILGKKILYSQILSATDEDNFRPSFALSSKRICIRYYEDDVIKQTYISPVNREQFRLALNDAIAKSVVKASKVSEEELAEVEATKEKLAKGRKSSKSSADVAKNTKKVDDQKVLDDIIAGKINVADVVLSKEQEDLLDKMLKEQRKLLKKEEKAKKEQAKKGASAKAIEVVDEKQKLKDALLGKKPAEEEPNKEVKGTKGLKGIVEKISKKETAKAVKQETKDTVKKEKKKSSKKPKKVNVR